MGQREKPLAGASPGNRAALTYRTCVIMTRKNFRLRTARCLGSGDGTTTSGLVESTVSTVYSTGHAQAVISLTA